MRRRTCWLRFTGCTKELFVWKWTVQHRQVKLGVVALRPPPTLAVVICALKACWRTGNVEHGRRIHFDASNQLSDSHVASSLINMYAKCGSFVEACSVFEGIQDHSVVSWTAMMMAFTQNGEAKQAIDLFRRMASEGYEPDGRTYVAAVVACTSLAGKEDGELVDGEVVKLKCLEIGMEIHSQALKRGYETDVFVGSALVEFYAKCGSILDAQMVFNRMPCHSLVSWTSLILGYEQNGESEQAVRTFATMQQEGFDPDGRAFVAVLMAHASLAVKEDGCLVDGKVVKVQALKKGTAIHTQVIQSGCATDIFLESTLVDMYSKCGSLANSRSVFDRMKRHDVVAWNGLIVGYTENDESEVALHLFRRMLQEDCAPNSRTFIAALGACSNLAAKEPGVQIGGRLVKLESLTHVMCIECEAAKTSHLLDIFTANTLLDAYAKCGSLVESRRVFDTMMVHNVVSWTALILGHVENGESGLALELFREMKLAGCQPNSRSYVGALMAVGEEASHHRAPKWWCLEQGMSVHLEASKTSCDSNAFVASTLIEMYARCGSMIEARGLFDSLPFHRASVVSWNALIFGYADNDEQELALSLFELMQQSCNPDSRTLVAALGACGSLAGKEDGKPVSGKLVVKLRGLEKAMFLHAQAMRLGLDSNTFVANSLIDTYGKCGSLLDARRVFDRMASPGIVSWNSLVLGCVENGESELALRLFRWMVVEGWLPDAITFVSCFKACIDQAEKETGHVVEGKIVKLKSLDTGMALHTQALDSGFSGSTFVSSSIVDMYVKCGSLVDARRVLEKFPRGALAMAAWNALLSGYAENGEEDLALDLFWTMRERSYEPDARTLVAAIAACCGLGALEIGKQIHAEIHRAGLFESDAFVANSLIDFYGKCGCMDVAELLFGSIGSKSTVTWNALLTGYSSQGDCHRVLELFPRMWEEGTCPDGVSFLAVLTACSHSGMVERGEKWLTAMSSSRFGVRPGIEHYHCWIDLLGRANRLEEAIQVARAMPFEANSATWQTVLGACWKWKNSKVAEVAFRELDSIDRLDPTVYVVMANILLWTK